LDQAGAGLPTFASGSGELLHQLEDALLARATGHALVSAEILGCLETRALLGTLHLCQIVLQIALALLAHTRRLGGILARRFVVIAQTTAARETSVGVEAGLDGIGQVGGPIGLITVTELSTVVLQAYFSRTSRGTGLAWS